MKRRYLLYFSYIGTYFKSSVRQSKILDTTSVIGALEWALGNIVRSSTNISEASSVIISSRTDSGVHAFQNTAHFDLVHSDEEFHAPTLINALNKNCMRHSIPLRVTNLLPVCDHFSARRFARLRTYLYRVAIPKFGDLRNTEALVPISEYDRCHFSRFHSFDINALEKVLKLFTGTHDFRAFTGKPKLHLSRRTPIRHIVSFSVHRRKRCANSLYEASHENFDYWDFIIEGCSFTYRQVRLMISAALEVASGRLLIEDVQKALDSPASVSTSSRSKLVHKLVPAHGLYLIKVTYDEKDLAVDRKDPVASKEHTKLLQILDNLRLSKGTL